MGTKCTVGSTHNAGSALTKRLPFKVRFCSNLGSYMVIHEYHWILHLWKCSLDAYKKLCT